MFKKTLVILSILIFSYSGLAAKELFVDYLDGNLEIQTGDSWDLLYIGDLIQEDDIIRLSDNGYAELLLDDFKISLDKDGVYEVEILVGQIVKADKWGIKGSSFAKLFRDDEVESRQSAVMGVRGDPQDEEEITWVDDDVEFLEEGKSLYMDGDFEEALLILEEGAEWYGSNYDEILFYKALCEYETGRFRMMRESIFEMDPYADAEFFEDFVLLKGNLLIESRNFIDAEELFNRYFEESVAKDAEQAIMLMSAFCSIELERLNDARRKLKDAVDMDPLSETGRKASEILKSL